MIYEKNFTTQKKKHIHFILLKYSWFKMCWFLIYTKVILSLSYTQTHILFHYDLLKDIGYPCATCCCSVAQLCLTLCDPMDCITPGFPALHHLLELAQTHVHWVDDAIQPSHPLSSPSPPAFNLSQHQGLFQWVSYLHQVAKLWELQLQHQSFQWIIRTDFL